MRDTSDDEREIEGEDMSTTERELADDAQWKIIQKNTFMRWANEHLKTVNKVIADLESDFSDGLRLIALIEVLSGKKFRHINKRPNFRTQKLENVTLTLRLLEEDEGIKIVNIDSSDIVDKNLKLILGLLWTLILHYSISMPIYEGEEQTPSHGGPPPSQRLLNWIQYKVPDLPIKNFTTDWNDGRAIGALVDSIGPGLCPDWDDWDPWKARSNATEAMDAAEKWLNVPQLIKPDELTNPKVDDLSMMTYLSQFPNARLKPGAPTRPRVNAARVRAYGPGLEGKGNQVAAPACFTVETFSAGKGSVEVIVINPRGAKEPVVIKFAGKEIPKSPFEVSVEGATGDASKVSAKGPGVERIGVVQSKRTHFEVYTQGAGLGMVDVMIMDDKGHKDKILPSIQPVIGKAGAYLVEYTPTNHGLHSVNVSFAGCFIPSSPFGVNVGLASNAKECYSTGRGVQPRGLRVGEPAEFLVHTQNAGEGDLTVQVTGLGGKEETVSMRYLPEQPGIYACVYTPSKPGSHAVNVMFGDQHISKSPFKVDVGPAWNSQIRAFGPGLEGGVVNQQAVFTVVTNGETGALGFSIEGPSQAKIDCEDNGDGSAKVTYWPTSPGEYAVHILCDEQDIPKSPYMADIKTGANFYPDKVVAKGPGLERMGVTMNNPAVFTVDTRSAGRAPLAIDCLDGDLNPVDVRTQDNKDGTYTCIYIPSHSGPQTVSVNYGGVAVPASPFRVPISEASDPSKVKVHGPGVSPAGVKMNSKTYFIVDCTQAGPGDVAVGLTDERGVDVPVTTTDNSDGSFTVEYEPKSHGCFSVLTYFAEKPVPQSPIKVNVQPGVDVTGVTVHHLDPQIPVGRQRTCQIKVPPRLRKAPVRMDIVTPSGKTVSVPVSDGMDGKVAPFTLRELGPHTVAVKVDGVPVTDSPFYVEAIAEAPKVKAYGPGLKGGEALKPATFTIDAHNETTPGSLGVTVEGPVESKIDVRDNGDGTCCVSYIPELPGEYRINVSHADRPIADSPFLANITPSRKGPDYSQPPNVKAYGPGLVGGECCKPALFTIDAREETFPGSLGVTVEGPKECVFNCTDNGDGTCSVSYVPEFPGTYKINISHAERPIHGSPFLPSIKPAANGLDVSGVKAYGPGLSPAGVFTESPTHFVVNAQSVMPNGNGRVDAILTTPTGNKIQTLVGNNDDGTYNVLYTPMEQGTQQLDVAYQNVPIPGSPFTVEAAPGCDANRVTAYGPGLDGAIARQAAQFTVDMKGAGKGGLDLSIQGPVEAEIKCHDNRDGTCDVQYIPAKAGVHDIFVNFADHAIPGSPFRVMVNNPLDASKVKCYGPGIMPEGPVADSPTTFTIDTADAGEGLLCVTINDELGNSKSAALTPLDEGHTQATYLPLVKGLCSVDVQYGGRPVPGSPFQTYVSPAVDANQVDVMGLMREVPASLPVQFQVDTRNAGPADLDAIVQRPDGSFIRPCIQENGSGVYDVVFTPEDLGTYMVDVKHGGKDVPGSAFPVDATPIADASKCRITEGVCKKYPVHQNACILVDVSEAGNGKVTCRIRSPAGSDIDIDITDRDDGTFSISFTPQSKGEYVIEIKFGGNVIPNGSFFVEAAEDYIVADSVDSVYSSVPSLAVYQPVDMVFRVGPVFSFVSASVVTPSGRTESVKVEDNRDGTVTVRYKPNEAGLHQLHVNYNNQPINDSPFFFHVYPANCGHVTAHGPGLCYGVVYKLAPFTINTKEAGPGGLSLSVEGPSKTEISCVDNQDGTCSVSYVPTSPGEYVISIKFADRCIVGSPFTAKITPGEPRQKAQMSVGGNSEVSLNVTESDIDDLTASITSPSGREGPCLLKRLSNGHLGITFSPYESGQHLVNVFRDGRHIANSPFPVSVGQTELANAGMVKVSGQGISTGMANEVNEFVIDNRDAGYGGLCLAIEGPSKADIECHDNEDGTCRVTYRPTEPGNYMISIKYADHHVPGSPFSVDVGGEPSRKVTEQITRHKPAADVMHVGSDCELRLKVPPGISASHDYLTAVAKSPSGLTDVCQVSRIDQDHYRVRFVPQEMGVHIVSVKHKDMHLPGSPFQFTVGPIAAGGSHKVRASGLGLQHGEVQQPCDFSIYTREAGAGALSIAVEGPSKAEIDFQDRGDGSCGVTYVVTEPGDYYVSVKFNNEHIPDSPFALSVSPSIGEARKVSMATSQDKGLQVGKPATFIVNFNGAEGKLRPTIITPSGRHVEALVQEVDDGKYVVRFIPHENGVHHVQTLFDGRHIPGSPFRLVVGSKTEGADAGKVSAYGAGLQHGTTDQVSSFIINTVNAGSGSLAVTVEGPSKVKLECQEVDEGYRFTYRPKAPGDYLISIKYDSIHIAGSPFKARIGGPGEASLVPEHASVVVETVTKTSTTRKYSGVKQLSSDAGRCLTDGDGLNTAFTGKTASFTVDTKGAGSEVLYVGMKGPDCPADELLVKYVGDSKYRIDYTVKRPGQYTLIVRWGEQDIPGSPFAVHVL